MKTPERIDLDLKELDALLKRAKAVLSSEDYEIIKQIPPEELLRIAARFRDLQGKLFDLKA